jgi:hypothetical protein
LLLVQVKQIESQHFYVGIDKGSIRNVVLGLYEKYDHIVMCSM